MKSFHQWREQVDLPVESQPDSLAINPTVGNSPAEQPKISTKEFLKLNHIKPWKASKEEIVPFWKTLSSNTPLQLQPIKADHEGSTIQEDGVRITGSKEFISSVLSRLKDFIPYENPKTKLMIAYRQSPRSFLPGNKNSYIFYLQAMERGGSS